MADANFPMGNADIFNAMLAKILGSGLTPGPDYQKPVFPSSFKEAGSNLLHGLSWYGEENLKRNMGIPYQDPTQTALARAQLAAHVDKLRSQAQARQLAGGDETKIFEPKLKVTTVPKGTYDPMTDEPEYHSFTERQFAPWQKQAAEVLYNRRLEDTDPNDISKFMENLNRLKEWTSIARENTAARKEASERSAADREASRQSLELSRRNAEDVRRQNLSIRKEASKRSALDIGLKMFHDPGVVAQVAEENTDPETGELNLTGFLRGLKTNPAYQEKVRQFNAKLSVMKDRAEIERKKASQYLKQSGDRDGYMFYDRELKKWKAEFDAFEADLSNIGKPFPVPPPSIEDFVTRPGMQSPSPTARPGAPRGGGNFMGGMTPGASQLEMEIQELFGGRKP